VGDLSPTFLVFQASFFPVVVATISGVQLVGREYIRAAQNFGITGFKLFRTIIVPGALPTIITGMRVGLGVAWLVVVAAEMVGITSGLGYLIIDARNAGMRYDLVVAGMLAIGTIGLFLDLCMRRLENLREIRWRYAGGR
jgi:NitT/TauT family transport system permease protein